LRKRIFQGATSTCGVWFDPPALRKSEQIAL